MHNAYMLVSESLCFLVLHSSRRVLRIACTHSRRDRHVLISRNPT